MGYQVYAYVVVGARVMDVFQAKEQITKEQKFDENTGVPYQRESRRVYWTLFGKNYPENVDLEGAATKDFDKDLEIIEAYSERMMDAPHSIRNGILIGFKASEVGPYTSAFAPVDSKKVVELSERFYAKTGAQPNVYLIQYHSY